MPRDLFEETGITPSSGEQPKDLFEERSKVLTMEERTAKYGGIYNPPPWYVSAIRPTLQTVGLVGGGIVGAGSGLLASAPTAFTTAPATSTAGAVTGSALGYAAMNQAATAIEQALGYKKPRSLKEQAIESGKDVLTGAALEAGGQLAALPVAAISRSAGPAIKSWTEKGMRAAEVKQAAQAAKELGYEMTPAQEAGSKGAMLVEKALSYIPGSAGTIQKKYFSQLQKLTELRNDFIDKVNNGKGTPESVENVGLKIKATIEKMLGGKEALKNQRTRELADSMLKKMGSTDTYESLGLKTKEILEKRMAEATAKKNAVYAEIGESVPSGPLDTPNINEVAQQAKESLGKSLAPGSTLRTVLSKISGASKSAEELPPTVNVQGIETKISELPSQMRAWLSQEETVAAGVPARDWKTLQQWRSELTDLVKSSRKSGNLTESRVYLQLKNALDQDFQVIAEKTGTNALDKLKIANAFYREEFAPIWRNKDIMRLAESKPETVVDTIFRPGNVTVINTTKKALGEQGFQPLKQKFVGKLIDSASKGGEFSWDKLVAEAQKYGTETLHTIFTPREWQMLATYATRGLREEAMPIADRFILDIAKKSTGEQVSNFIFTKNNSINVAKVKRIIPKDVFDEARSKWLSDNILKESTHGLYQPISAATQIAKMDQPTMKAIFSKDELQFIDRMFQVSKSAETVEKLSGNPSGTAQAVITFEAGRMILSGIAEGAIGLATGNVAKVGKAGAKIAGITLAPQLVAKLYLSPVGRKFILQGLKLPPGTPQATALVTKLVALMAKQSGKGERTENQSIDELLNELNQEETQ
ncbi:MAG: hypothetical protein PHY29_03065 [Syntrophales bacterium]|nr:hypothetical protein [Syntrophales bacterium]